ncbi:coiled-coil domain-containing protein 186 isoform X1 [Bemisia tabaci]|uniref:coiled-coil domain-containing protein 186 isoform X1 n=1 Tax=Bemisia tabaci TaxID=7038 RepID=UPI003B289076
MIICSSAIALGDNFALMNVNAPVSVEKIVQNDGGVFEFTEDGQHHPFLNGVIDSPTGGAKKSLSQQTCGEAADDSNENSPRSTSIENGSLCKLTKDNPISIPKNLELGRSVCSFSEETGEMLTISTEQNGVDECMKSDTECLEKKLDSNVPYADLNSVNYKNSINLPALIDTTSSLSSTLTRMVSETVNSAVCESPGVHKIPMLNNSDALIEATAQSSENVKTALTLNNFNNSINDLVLESHNPKEYMDVTDELNLLLRHSEGDVMLNEQKNASSSEGEGENSTGSNRADEIDLNNAQAENSVLNLSPVKNSEGLRRTLEDLSELDQDPQKQQTVGEPHDEINSMNIQDYANLKVECSHYKSENEQLQHRLSILESELNSFKAQQSQLLSTIEQQEKQINQINENAKRQQEVDAKSYEKFKQELEMQNEKLKKEWETMKHEKELSVMKYAKGEMDVIKLREKSEAFQKKLLEVTKERDNAHANMKQLISDKAKYSQMYDNKCSEVRVAHNEIEQLKSDLNSNNNKLKKTQNKLKEEQESHKETQSKLDEVTSTIESAKKEAEQVKLEAEASIKKFKVSQENRAFVLEQQLKEEQAKLILSRAEKEDLDKKIQTLSAKLQQTETEIKKLTETNECLSEQVCSIEKEKLELEVKLSTMQQLMDKEVQENVELESKLSELRTVKQELEEEKKKTASLETEAITLRTSNEELLIDMESCRKREAEMLDFTERLTAQNVKLQSDFSALKAKNEELEIEQSKVNEIKAELEDVKSQRSEESKILSHQIEEHTQRYEEISKQLAEQKSENVVLRRKNAATIRELTRELQQLKKQLTEHSDGGGSGSNSLCQDSRASSCTSLTDTSQALSSNPGSIRMEPDKQTLIERIVELQRRNAQYLEKIEFLEEHNKEMTEELKKKSKIVQNFMLREPVGALSSNSMDTNKLFLMQSLYLTKEMALSKKGYMASLYSSQIKDKNMTLETSLEICQTLHSLLEDTILKNITLKENMDTLGEEIARLRSEQTKEGKS